MRFLHTSDWHLGKTLEGNSRLEEQELFLEELNRIANERQVDMVLVSGDIYDTVNPPAAAEELFYRGVKELAKGGKRPVVIIAGNHDSPERLQAAAPVCYDQGIILLGVPKSTAKVGDFGAYSIVKSGEGFLEIAVDNGSAVILTMPYPSERRLDEVLTEVLDEGEAQLQYSEKVGELFRQGEKHFRDDTVNLAMGHF